MKMSGTGPMREGLRDLLDQIEEALSHAGDRAGETADAATDQARDSLRRAAEHLRAAEQEISGHARDLDRLVRANPWPAIAATGLIAFVAGLLVRRR